MNRSFLKFLLNLYPPLWGTGIHVKRISRDFREIQVEMRMRFYNRNYVKTYFGGSLYAMTDPFYMLMLIRILGDGYIVWDHSARIDFIKPGTGKVSALFVLSEDRVREIVQNTADGQKYCPEFMIDIKDEAGDLVSRVTKTIYIRKKS